MKQNIVCNFNHQNIIFNQKESKYNGANYNNEYTEKQKAIITATSVLGVATACSVLSKFAKKPLSSEAYSLNPKKIYNNIKNSYLANVKFEEKEVISIGAGSILGGLTGGYIIDKNSENRKAKRREAFMQIGNVSVPILTVGFFARLAKKHGKVAQALAGIAGIFTGVFLANVLTNKIANIIFHNKNERGVKLTDFSAHVDDMVVAAEYVSSAKIIHYIARIIPLALIVPGIETGKKKA